MDIVVVGSVAFDSVKTPFGSAERVLGGSASYFSVAASFFTNVKIVAVVGDDFPEEHIRFFNSKGIDTAGLKREEGKTFFWKGEYTLSLNEAQTKDTQLNVFSGFHPELPKEYRKAHVVFLANIDPDLQQEVLQQVESPRLTAADTMNFWIQGKRESLLKTLRSIDLLLINETEARLLADEHNLVKAARVIGEMGPSRLVVKQGEYGALLFDEAGIFSVPAFPLQSVFDPTGCGDTFAGGFMGFLACTNNFSPEVLRKAMIFGSVLASFNVEKFGLDRLRTLTMGEIEQRYREFKKLVHFENI